MNFLEQIIFPLFILWALGAILAFFRRDLDFIWKAFFLLIFFFYFILFYEDIFRGYFRLINSYPHELIGYISGIGKVYFFALLFLWPITLIRIFYSASGHLSHLSIRVLVYSTLFYWFCYGIWLVFHNQMDRFFSYKLIEFLKL
ncbi:MAG: hypothetical protein H7A25_08260 [Leptospiraceae bacterium]|nr:hypothetical protein [Leptospiraceae bacterium]MCP5499880.1 hypothetical protein [Leptospiraceae bacterium]